MNDIDVVRSIEYLLPQVGQNLLWHLNGTNFNAEHFGLYNMKERAKDIGAAIEIISEEGEGTEIKLEVPLK